MPEVTVKLSKAVETTDGPKDVLEFREPTVADYKVFDDVRPGLTGDKLSLGDMAHTAALAAERLAGLTAREAATISMKDGLKIFEAINVFFEE